MKESETRKNFRLLDNYISDFSLNVFNKIINSNNINLNVGVGFKIMNINMNDLVGQIELKHDIEITGTDNNIASTALANQSNTKGDSSKSLANISITMNALFKGEGSFDKTEFEDRLKFDGATIASHLCRAYITSATALAGMPPINLPLIDFEDFFKNGKSNK